MANYARETCRAIGAHLPDTDNTTVHTVSGYQQVIDVRCANLTGSPVDVTISWYSSRVDDEFSLIYQHEVPANGAVTFPLEGFAPIEDDEIRVQASAGNAIDVVMTIAEIPGRMS